MKKNEAELQERPGASAAPACHALDRADRAVLRALQRDASTSSVALAAKINLNPPACLHRMERLKELGLARGIVALLDPRALGLGSLMAVDVMLDRSMPEPFTALEEAVQRTPGCLECHVVIDESNYFILVCTKDNEIYNRLHAEQLLYLPDVQQIRTLMVLKRVLSTAELPVA